MHNHRDNDRITHNRAFLLGIILNIVFVVIEVIYGLAANSSALLADAGHNTSDILGLAFAWTAAWLATIKPSEKYTYGLKKTTILVALLNSVILIVASVFIALGAFKKLLQPQSVEGEQVMIIAGIGVIINALTALLFIKGQKDDLNIRGAFLHMAADAGISFGVVISGLLIKLTGKMWIDPVISFIIVGVIIHSIRGLFSGSVKLSLDGVPENIDSGKVRDFIMSQEGVKNLHDLHIWAMSTTQVALTAHIVRSSDDNDNFIKELQESLKKKFNIGHTTFQIESENLEQTCDTGC